MRFALLELQTSIESGLQVTVEPSKGERFTLAKVIYKCNYCRGKVSEDKLEAGKQPFHSTLLFTTFAGDPHERLIFTHQAP